MPPSPIDPLVPLQILLRNLSPVFESTISQLYGLDTSQLPTVRPILLAHIGDLFGLMFVSAQTAIKGVPARPSRQSALIAGHPWLTTIDFIEAAANFWKHCDQWDEAAWSTVEGPRPIQPPQRFKGPSDKTTVYLTGFELKRGDKHANMLGLATALGFEHNWDFSWLLAPVEAWHGS